MIQTSTIHETEGEREKGGWGASAGPWQQAGPPGRRHRERDMSLWSQYNMMFIL